MIAARSSSNRITRSLATRGLRTDASNRIHLDIHAAAHRDQSNAPKEAQQEPVQRSQAALLGQTIRGDVQLPIELEQTVDQLISEMQEDKQLIRQSALELYKHLRTTSGIPVSAPTSYKDKQALMPPMYDDRTSLAFLAGLMPSIFGATLNALEMTKSRLEWLSSSIKGEDHFEPDRVVDFGSGTGSAAWAVRDVWADSPQLVEYVGLDSELSMVELGSRVIGALPKRILDARSLSSSPSIPGDETELSAKIQQLALPASVSSFARLGLPLNPKSESSKSWDKTIALASFTLGELPTRETRKEFIRSMWDTGAEVIVVVERGTPQGSRIVKDAREQLLMLGRRDEEYARGCFVLAPCPHDGACPLHRSTKHFCHFPQRVRSPAFLRTTKHSSSGEDSAKFSYVVIKRGTRPAPPAPSSSIPAEVLSTSLIAPSSPPSSTLTSTSDRWTWPRIIAPPMKRSGHVILEVCSSAPLLDPSLEPTIERHTIPKSQGRQAYYDARKAAWGDSFPHPPKNGPQPVEIRVEDAKSSRSGMTIKDGWKEKGRKGWKRKAREAREAGLFGEVDEADNADGNQSGVREFEITLGDDGKFKVL